MPPYSGELAASNYRTIRTNAAIRVGLRRRIRLDTLLAMNSFLRSAGFDGWLSGLADQKAKARILARLRSASLGNFGDCESVGEGVSEMRIHFGPGYRVYFVRTESSVYVLLGGGDKSSQRRDIARAQDMARQLKDVKS
jgi:putative addiction module killer protein